MWKIRLSPPVLFWSLTLIIVLVAALVPAASPDRSGEPAISEIVEVAPRLGDRSFIASVLSGVFGPAGDPVIERMVVRLPTIFGGPCDAYRQVGTDPVREGSRFFRCPQGKISSDAPVIGLPSEVRVGYLSRACAKLTSNQETLDFALVRLFPSGSLRAPDEDNLVKAFQFFSPERSPSAAVLQSLSRIAADQSDLRARWGRVFYILCSDAKWQIL